MLKYLSSDSLSSARELKAGFFDFGARVLTLPRTGGVSCRTSCASTLASWRREQFAQLQPYPREGLAKSGGCTHAMWKKPLQLSHRTESTLTEAAVSCHRGEFPSTW